MESDGQSDIVNAPSPSVGAGNGKCRHRSLRSSCLAAKRGNAARYQVRRQSAVLCLAEGAGARGASAAKINHLDNRPPPPASLAARNGLK